MVTPEYKESPIKPGKSTGASDVPEIDGLRMDITDAGD